MLLENFVAATTLLDQKAAMEEALEKKALRQYKNPLEPLVARCVADRISMRTYLVMRASFSNSCPIWSSSAPRGLAPLGAELPARGHGIFRWLMQASTNPCHEAAGTNSRCAAGCWQPTRRRAIVCARMVRLAGVSGLTCVVRG